MFQGASPQLTFIFGLIAGVAASAVIGLVIFLTGGYTPSKSAASTVNTNAVAAANTGAQTFGNVKAISDADYIRGDKNAKVTLIEYSDYECPFCKSFHPTMQQVMKDYDGKVRWVYRHFPLSFHQNAQKEAEAGLCVGKLGGADKFWTFTDKIFERTTSNGTGFALTDLGALAKESGVNQDKFQTCLDGNEMAARVADEEADGGQGGATGTPTTFVVDKDGKTVAGIPGAYSYAQVKAILDTALAS